jgi:hypothetical protein
VAEFRSGSLGRSEFLSAAGFEFEHAGAPPEATARANKEFVLQRISNAEHYLDRPIGSKPQERLHNRGLAVCFVPAEREDSDGGLRWGKENKLPGEC